MKLRQTLALTLALTTLASAPASAATATPTDAELLGARTVGVLPILATGPSAAGSWTRVAIAIASARAGAGTQRLVAVEVQLAEVNGLAFAGQADAADLQVLRYGYYLGLLPGLIASGHEERAKVAAALAASTDLLAGLGPEVVASVKAALADTREVDGAAFARVLAGAQLGLAEGDARKNGYLAAGMWLGLSSLAVLQGAADETLLGMAAPLIALLEEDAAFGAADREVARILREVAIELGRTSFDGGRVLRLGAEVLEVGKGGAAPDAGQR